MSARNRIQILRRRAFERQQGRCCYCSVAMWLTTSDELPGKRLKLSAYARLKCTAEHLVAQSDGGRDVAGNITAACAHCNHTRHKRKKPPAPDRYREEVARRMQRGAWHHPWVFELGLTVGPTA